MTSHNEAQKTKADWLRSEIEKLDKEEAEPATGHPAQFNYDTEWYVGYNQCRTSIITRYKEELLELEK